MKTVRSNAFRTAACLSAIAALGGIARADLLLYDGFNYTANTPLGGTGTTPVGQVNTASGATWYGRSTSAAYNATNDSTVIAGNLSYTGLALSAGNSISLGGAAANPALATDSIALPGGPISSGTVYYSMLLKVNSTTGLSAANPLRFAPASLSIDSSAAADAGTTPSSYTTTLSKPLPAGLWMRAQSAGSSVYQFGSGKQNGDGLGNSDGAQGWQNATQTYFNQSGANVTGAGQTAPSGSYFIVMKYTFGTTPLTAFQGGANSGQPANQKDTVSIYVNPVASTLGDNAGEATAATPTGAYYSSINAFAGVVNVDAGTIKSFFLNGNVMTTQGNTAQLTVDELRIGTTWSDVTPAAPYFWDIDGTNPGPGSTAPSGTWDGTTQNFNSDSTGGAGGVLLANPNGTSAVSFAAGTTATGTYTVNVSGTRAAKSLNFTQGDVTLNGGTVAVGAVDVAAGATATIASTLSGGTNGKLTKTGAGTLTLSSANTHTGGTTVSNGTLVAANADAFNAGSLTVSTGAKAQFQAGLAKAVTLSSLSTDGTGQLDVTNNSMVIRSSSLAAVQAQIASGFANGAWTGVGIDSSTAAADGMHRTAIGYADNAVLNKSSFKGVSGLTGTDVLVKFTYYGDADLNGVVTLDDFTQFLSGYQGNGTTWLVGDFDYNGKVTLDDFTLFLDAYQNQGAPLTALGEAIQTANVSSADRAMMLAAIQAVPEPTATVGAVAALLGAASRRRRTAPPRVAAC